MPFKAARAGCGTGQSYRVKTTPRKTDAGPADLKSIARERQLMPEVRDKGGL
jgi:hypothetical protein